MNRKNLAGILISVMISVLLAALDSTIVGTAMPRIIGELHGMERYSWPFTAYMLFSTLAIVVFGKLSDLYGRKRIFLFGILFFLFSSALCGLSRSMLQLIVFRGLQGIGGGVIVSSAFIIIADLFSPRERGKYMGLVASMFGLASLLGPSAGGLITDHLSWRWVFYVNLPLGGIAFIVIVLLLPYLPPVAKGRRVDYGGAFFFLSTLLPLFLAFTLAGTEHQWLSGRIISLLLLSVVMFLLFMHTERRAEEPIIPFTMFKNPVFRVSAIAMFLSSAVMFCGVIYVPLFAQAVLGASATRSGMVTTPMMLGLTLSAIVSGQIISRTGRYRTFVLVSFVMSGVSLVLLSRMTITTPMHHILLYSALFGAGCGIVLPAFNIAVQNAFSRREVAPVTSSIQFFRNIGATVGTSLFGYVMSSTMKKGMAGMDLSGLPPSMAEVIVNPRALSNAEGLFQMRSHLPGGLLLVFDRLLDQMREVMAHALRDIFLGGLIIVVVALLVTLRLQELPLRRDEADSSEEPGASE